MPRIRDITVRREAVATITTTENGTSAVSASAPPSSASPALPKVKSEPTSQLQRNPLHAVQMSNLAKYLDPGKDKKSLFEFFGITTYQRGNEYFHDGMTWQLKLEEVMEVSDGVKLFKLSGNCWGNSIEPYAQELLLIPPTDTEPIQVQRAKCTCPVASKCKHA